MVNAGQEGNGGVSDVYAEAQFFVFDPRGRNTWFGDNRQLVAAVSRARKHEAGDRQMFSETTVRTVRLR